MSEMAPPRGAIGLGLAAVAVLAAAVAGLGAYSYRNGVRRAASVPDAIEIAVTARGCEPDTVAVPAGRTGFRILNRSDRALEWEILDGVMVVAERENIAPGFAQTLTARLEPGTYSITCGLLGNPRGRLTVLPAAGSTAGAAPAPPAALDLLGPVAEYKVYVTLQARALVGAADRLAEAARAGDLAAARAAQETARAAFDRLSPVARVLFADLAAALDGRAALRPLREADPGFTGFRRLDGALREGGQVELATLAEQLRDDARALRDHLAAPQPIAPERMLSGAMLALDGLRADRVGGAPADLVPAHLSAGLDGVGKVVALLRPLTRRTDPVLAERLDGRLAALRGALAAGDAAAGPDLDALATDLATLRDVLGLG